MILSHHYSPPFLIFHHYHISSLWYSSCSLVFLCSAPELMRPVLVGVSNPPPTAAGTYQLADTRLKQTPSSLCALALRPLLSGFSLWLNKCISSCHETTSLAANKEQEQDASATPARCECIAGRRGRKIGILTSMIDTPVCPWVVLFAEI